MLALQKAFDVPGDELALHRRSFSVAKLFRSRNSVSAGVLGNVHARICYADDVF